jgi:membrane-associated HD superfamily phosphohydrolase
MEEPTKSQLAISYEKARNEYWESFGEMNSSRFISSNFEHLEDEKRAERIANIRAEVARKLEAVTKTQELLEQLLSPLSQIGEKEFHDWEQAVYRWHDYKQALDNYNPETDTIRAVAEEIVKDESMVKFYADKKKRADRCRWWYRADRLALIREVERAHIEALARDYISANPMRYAVSTGNLTYLKRVA